MKCEACRYFAAKLSSLTAFKLREGVGECRRYAPRGPVTLGMNAGKADDGLRIAVVSGFAHVPADDWCGEFAPAAQESRS